MSISEFLNIPTRMDSETVVWRGKPTRVHEGDLLLVHSPGLLNRALGLVGGGYSHVATVVRLQGRLQALSVYVPPDGVMAEPLERFGCAAYSRLAVVRPHIPRREVQHVALRFAAADALQIDAATPGGAYEKGPLEFVATAFGWQALTKKAWTCSELAARLARAADAWPRGHTVSVRVDEVADLVGTIEVVF